MMLFGSWCFGKKRYGYMYPISVTTSHFHLYVPVRISEGCLYNGEEVQLTCKCHKGEHFSSGCNSSEEVQRHTVTNEHFFLYNGEEVQLTCKWVPQGSASANDMS